MIFEMSKNAKLDGCVICNNTRIGKNVTAKSGLILAEGCEIGELVTVEQDVTIWPDKMIQDAAIVSRSVILGSKYKNSIFENGLVIGKSNVESHRNGNQTSWKAFGAQLPVDSTVLVSRDSSKSSRMLKRAFWAGFYPREWMLSTTERYHRRLCGAVCRIMMSMRLGSYRRKLDDPTSTVITFYNHEALRINNDTAKK